MSEGAIKSEDRVTKSYIRVLGGLRRNKWVLSWGKTYRRDLTSAGTSDKEKHYLLK
jgi:hypothetical protein